MTIALKPKQKKHKPSPKSYQERNYRGQIHTSGLESFVVQVKETDLHLLATKKCREEAEHQVIGLRNQVENYICRQPLFLKSLAPLEADPLSPPIIKAMLLAGQAAGVGPMAAVAGAIAEFVGRALLKLSGVEEIVVENGGDIFLRRKEDCTVAIFAGTSPLSNAVGLKIKAGAMPVGVCTSSATVGHSLSLGQADAVTVIAASTALADAVATRIGNETKIDSDINAVLSLAAAIPGVSGVVIIRGEQLGAWGDIELVGL